MFTLIEGKSFFLTCLHDKTVRIRIVIQTQVLAAFIIIFDIL
jgi:hypothetical protein